MYYQLLPTPTFLTVFKYQKLPHQYKNRIAFTFSPHRNVLHLEKYAFFLSEDSFLKIYHLVNDQGATSLKQASNNDI